MAAGAVVVVEPGRQLCVTLLRVVTVPDVDPFPQCGLDEAFGPCHWCAGCKDGCGNGEALSAKLFDLRWADAVDGDVSCDRATRLVPRPDNGEPTCQRCGHSLKENRLDQLSRR